MTGDKKRWMAQESNNAESSYQWKSCREKLVTEFSLDNYYLIKELKYAVRK